MKEKSFCSYFSFLHAVEIKHLDENTKLWEFKHNEKAGFYLLIPKCQNNFYKGTLTRFEVQILVTNYLFNSDSQTAINKFG